MISSYTVSQCKFETTDIREGNRSIRSARRDWIMVCCGASPRLLVYVLERSETAEEVAWARDGIVSPHSPPRCVTSYVNLTGLLWWLSHNLYVSSLTYILQAMFPTWLHFNCKFIVYFLHCLTLHNLFLLLYCQF